MFYPVHQSFRQDSVEEAKYPIQESSHVLRSWRMTGSNVVEQPRHLFGLHACAFVPLHIGDCFMRGAVDLFACRGFVARIGKAGAHIARHHHRDGNPEISHFVRQRKRHRVDGGLGGRVECLIRNG